MHRLWAHRLKSNCVLLLYVLHTHTHTHTHTCSLLLGVIHILIQYLFRNRSLNQLCLQVEQDIVPFISPGKMRRQTQVEGVCIHFDIASTVRPDHPTTNSRAETLCQPLGARVIGKVNSSFTLLNQPSMTCINTQDCFLQRGKHAWRNKRAGSFRRECVISGAQTDLSTTTGLFKCKKCFGLQNSSLMLHTPRSKGQKSTTLGLVTSKEEKEAAQTFSSNNS